MNATRKFKLKVDLPFLQKGSVFWMEDSTGHVYAILDGEISEYPLRTGLAAYLWLLCTEKRYMKLLESKWDY